MFSPHLYTLFASIESFRQNFSSPACLLSLQDMLQLKATGLSCHCHSSSCRLTAGLKPPSSSIALLDQALGPLHSPARCSKSSCTCMRLMESQASREWLCQLRPNSSAHHMERCFPGVGLQGTCILRRDMGLYSYS